VVSREALLDWNVATGTASLYLALDWVSGTLDVNPLAKP
jgi:hypothetical protein